MLWARRLGLALSLSITVSCAVSTPPIIRPLPSLQTIPSQVLPSVPMRFNARWLEPGRTGLGQA